MASPMRVVVVGAGFAGLRVARRLQDKADVTVVAPTDRFTYLPMIHEVLSDTTTATKASRPLVDILPDARLEHGRAVKVAGKYLFTAAGKRIKFDRLVVAIGAEPNDFGVPGVREHALSFYSMGDALRANATLKVAAAEVQGKRPVRVVVVGGGFTGIEVAAEAKHLLDKSAAPSEVVILDALPKIFPHQDDEFRDEIITGLERTGIELRTGQKITEVAPEGVCVAGAKEGETEFIESDVTFWCAGVRPRTLEGVDPLVKPTLQSVARDDVFVLGDTARFPRDAAPVPKLAQTAEQMAPVVAHNILNPDRMRAYKPNVKGLIVAIGPRYAVAELPTGVHAGRIPWEVKRRLYKAKIALA